jgi:hypothetical protein
MYALPASNRTARLRAALLAGAFILLAVPAFCQTVDINVGPDPLWSPTFDDTYLSGLAGSDFTSTQSSAPNQVTIDVANLRHFNNHWRIQIKKTDIWSGGLTLWIARTNDGIGSKDLVTAPPLNTFRQITNSDTDLITDGWRVRTGMLYQLQVQGLSVSLGAATFTTLVTFTLTDW